MILRNRKGLGFIAIMIIIALVALFLRVGIEQLMQINIAQNESSAVASLKLISTALENFAKNNHGVFPSSISVLTSSRPAYLESDYFTQSSLKGYSYNCLRVDTSGYSCVASPSKCRITGKQVFTITTGGSLTTDDCSK